MLEALGTDADAGSHLTDCDPEPARRRRSAHRLGAVDRLTDDVGVAGVLAVSATTCISTRRAVDRPTGPTARRGVDRVASSDGSVTTNASVWRATSP